MGTSSSISAGCGSGSTIDYRFTHGLVPVQANECQKGPVPMIVSLREVSDADLPIFFEHQQDAEAVVMAAFTHKDPSDRAAFDAHWARIRASDSVINRTIEVG